MIKEEEYNLTYWVYLAPLRVRDPSTDFLELVEELKGLSNCRTRSNTELSYTTESLDDARKMFWRAKDLWKKYKLVDSVTITDALCPCCGSCSVNET